ncbi:MAG: restriction endonuclease subunit S [Campylobacterales bacterium]|nr:restriction endonuclease subunit S [Campylobacterales bacterium]
MVEKVKLSEILKVKTGKYDANHEDKNGEYDFFTCALKPCKTNTFSFDDEVIILPGNGANVGQVIYHNGKLEAYQRTYVLHEIKCNVKYLYYILKSNWKKHTLKNEVGSATNYIKLAHITDFKIPFLDLNQQNQIAKTLDKVNELIELRKESITKLDTLAKSIFIDMFGDPVSNPKKWKIKKLKQLTDVKTGKTPSRDELLYWENGTELWATTTEVNKRFIFDTQEKVTKYAVEKCKLTVYPENTILIAMYGQGKTRGNVVLLKAKSTINQAFGAILSSENIHQEFLLSLLKNSYSHIRSLGRGGNQENLNLDIVKNLDIINPPLDLQNKFSKIIEKIEEQKTLYTQELEKLQNNFDALLQKSFQE